MDRANSPAFTHLLITRFNIRVKGHGPERMESPEMESAWLEERFRLFFRYCAPSLLSQSHRRFTWMLYLDPDTPSRFSEMLHAHPFGDLQVEVRYAMDYDHMLADLRHYIRGLATAYVITTRLDNDDIVSFDFIQDIQAAFVPRERGIINFLSGYEYSTGDRVLKLWNVRYMNQFISLIESTKTDDLLTVYQFPHWKLPERATVINIGEKPYWIYLRHALNYSGQKINAIPIFRKTGRLSRFPAFVPILKISIPHTLLYSVSWFPKMFWRRLRGLFR